jgi:predicted enzyme related to lactoylglutathione lyase
VAQDVEQATAFWQQALGLTVRFRDGDRWVQFKAGNDPMALSSPEEGEPNQTGAVPVFEVDDLDTHAADIAGHGGKVHGVRDMGSHGRVLTFSDPDGNVAQLLHRPG